MTLAAQLRYDRDFHEAAALAGDLEHAGLDCLWVAETYGFDAPSFLGFLASRTKRVHLGAGILPLYSRSPALIAMTAAGIDHLSGGRFHLGVGVSGPQVIEGWHGVRYDRPLARTRETVTMCRQIWRKERLEHDGSAYEVPLRQGAATGLGKPLKLLTTPDRAVIPIWIAAMGERNVALAAEVADGWLPAFFVPELAGDVWTVALAKGRAARSPALGPLQLAAGGPAVVSEDADTVARAHATARGILALYLGGMGAPRRNFYHDLACRYGYGPAAGTVQEHYLAGRRRDALAAVPEELVVRTSLAGPRSLVAERVAAYRDAGVTMLNVVLPDRDPLETVTSLRLILDDL